MRLKGLMKKEGTRLYIGEIRSVQQNTLELEFGCLYYNIGYDPDTIRRLGLRKGSKVIIYADKRNDTVIQVFSEDGRTLYNRKYD